MPKQVTKKVAPAKKAAPAKSPAKSVAPKVNEPKSKPIKKGEKVDKKVVTAVKKESNASAKGGKKLLELGLLCDCTSSMSSWIVRAKQTLQEIITNVVSSTEGLEVRVSFIGYRDHCDTERYSIQPFSNNMDTVRDFISKVSATGGGDLPEDVVGGLRKCLD